jgi:hypothetical protein
MSVWTQDDLVLLRQIKPGRSNAADRIRRALRKRHSKTAIEAKVSVLRGRGEVEDAKVALRPARLSARYHN